MDGKLSREQAECIRRKNDVLSKGSYTPIPHDLYRRRLVDMHVKYDKRDVRDALFIYGLLNAYVNGESDKEYYLWSFLTVNQIADMTGIDRNRIKPLCDLLEAEGLLVTHVMRTPTGRKKFYMPML